MSRMYLRWLVFRRFETTNNLVFSMAALPSVGYTGKGGKVYTKPTSNGANSDGTCAYMPLLLCSCGFHLTTVFHPVVITPPPNTLTLPRVPRELNECW